ncbi:MAG TPA: haloalkane dehalogenase [Methylomirabilota bacterium]|nr:haloalkane dehalogenase [Methylomirabilota bacterium]
MSLGNVYRTPDERFANLPDFPFAPHYLELDGLRMHYLDEGQGEPILLLHGEPTWGFLYRRMIPRLRTRFRCIAPDYIGFGRSDKWTDVGAYSIARHFAFLERFVAALDLRRITVIVQDWGGPLGLHYAIRQPERMARLVILNTGLLSGNAETLTPGLWSWREYVSRTPDLPIGLILKRSIGTRYELTPEIVAAYDAPFPTLESKAGARAFPALIPTTPDAPGASEMRETAAALAKWDKPVLVCFSDSDPVFPPQVGEAFARLIPGARFTLIPDAGHFLQEEKGPEIAEEILRFVPD